MRLGLVEPDPHVAEQTRKKTGTLAECTEMVIECLL